MTRHCVTRARAGTRARRRGSRRGCVIRERRAPTSAVSPPPSPFEACRGVRARARDDGVVFIGTTTTASTRPRRTNVLGRDERVGVVRPPAPPARWSRGTARASRRHDGDGGARRARGRARAGRYHFDHASLVAADAHLRATQASASGWVVARAILGARGEATGGSRARRDDAPRQGAVGAFRDDPLGRRGDAVGGARPGSACARRRRHRARSAPREPRPPPSPPRGAPTSSPISSRAPSRTPHRTPPRRPADGTKASAARGARRRRVTRRRRRGAASTDAARDRAASRRHRIGRPRGRPPRHRRGAPSPRPRSSPPRARRAAFARARRVDRPRVVREACANVIRARSPPLVAAARDGRRPDRRERRRVARHRRRSPAGSIGGDRVRPERRRRVRRRPREG